MRKDIRWRDRSGAEVIARRCAESYPTNGRVYRKMSEWLHKYADERVGLVLWGIGNHGGGPSRADLDGIAQFAKEHPQYAFIHSTPEAYHICQTSSSRSM